MRSYPVYPDLFTHRNLSALPERAQRAAEVLGRALRSGLPDPSEIAEFHAALRPLSAETAPRAEPEIRDIAQLYNRLNRWGRVYDRDGVPGEEVPWSDVALNSIPSLGWLLLFHASGRTRDLALQVLDGPPRSEFEFSAIVNRLNDWAGEVRESAVDYADRYFPETAPEIIANSAFFLLPRIRLLDRWPPENRDRLMTIFLRPDVLDLLKGQFLSQRPGRMGNMVRQLLRRPDLDRHLPELAEHAAMPGIRAIAIKALLSGEAEWLTDYQWVRSDSYNIQMHRFSEFVTRPLTIQLDFDTFLTLAARDRAAQIRKVAASAIIEKMASGNPLHHRLALELADDNNAAVRDRIDFYLRKRAETDG